MSDKPNSPNLDLINRVQQARMAYDAQAQPSQVSAVYWIEAKTQQADVPAPTPRGGYWCVETTVQAVDALWAQIRQATESGLLGYKSKVSTVPANGQTHPDARVIHVRTYDHTDTADLRRVRDALRELGITQEIAYYTDQQG